MKAANTPSHKQGRYIALVKVTQAARHEAEGDDTRRLVAPLGWICALFKRHICVSGEEEAGSRSQRQWMALVAIIRLRQAIWD